jgi:AcrR family transcriptional regulator
VPSCVGSHNEHAHFSLDGQSAVELIYEHAHFEGQPDPMRITAEAKSATRQRILQAAMSLFVSDGWQHTTTRGIAVAAGIATGTLFNYFPTKEAIAAALMAEFARSRPLLAHLVRPAQPPRVSQMPRGGLRNDLQSARAPVSRQPRRCHTRRSPGTGGGNPHLSRLSRPSAGCNCATLLDSLSRRFRILGSRRFARPGRHPGPVGSVPQAVCRISEV